MGEQVMELCHDPSWSNPGDAIPPTGNQLVRTTMDKSARARTSSGMHKRREVLPSANRSSQRPEWSAIQIPRGTAISHARKVADAVSSRVLRVRTMSRPLTGVL